MAEQTLKRPVPIAEDMAGQPIPKRALPSYQKPVQRPVDPTAGTIFITAESLLRLWDRHIPLLTSYEDWDEWDARLHNLLRPFAGVVEILDGKIIEGQPGYDLQIDIALLAIIDRKVDSSMYTPLATLYNSGHRKGSIARKWLKDECSRLKEEDLREEHHYEEEW